MMASEASVAHLLLLLLPLIVLLQGNTMLVTGSAKATAAAAAAVEGWTDERPKAMTQDTDAKDTEERQLMEEATIYWNKRTTPHLAHWRSHWKADPNQRAQVPGLHGAADRDWLAIGEKHMTRVEHLLRMAAAADDPSSSGSSSESPPFHQQIRVALEWGPGGGSNLVALVHRRVPLILGADIARPTLEQAQGEVQRAGCRGATPKTPVANPSGSTGPSICKLFLFDTQQPESVLRTMASNALASTNDHEALELPPASGVPGTVDLFLSTAVFQHFPSKGYGVRVTRIAYEALREGGVALIQIRYYEGTKNGDSSSSEERKYAAKTSNYAQNAIFFTSYGIAEFWSVLRKVGFQPLSVDLEEATHYAYFYAMKPKRA